MRGGSRTIRVALAAIGVAATTGVALAVAGGFTDADGAFHGCVSNSGGLRVVTPGMACQANDTAIEWNQTGPQGTQGEQGPQGEQGAAGITDAHYTAGADHIPLSGGGGTTLLGLSLPAGAWYVSGSVNLGNFSGGRVPVLCHLYAVNFGQVGQLSIAGLASFPGNGGDALTLPLAAVVDLPGPDTVKMNCQSNTGTSAQAFAEGRQMTALSISQLTVHP